MFSMWSKKMDSFNREEDEGLKLILKKRNSNSYNNNNNNNNVAVIKVKPIFLFNQIVNSTTVSNTDHHDDHCCYLKSCHLCLKPLPLDKEIYMYRYFIYSLFFFFINLYIHCLIYQKQLIYIFVQRSIINLYILQG